MKIVRGGGDVTPTPTPTPEPVDNSNEFSNLPFPTKLVGWYEIGNESLSYSYDTHEVTLTKPIIFKDDLLEYLRNYNNGQNADNIKLYPVLEYKENIVDGTRNIFVDAPLVEITANYIKDNQYDMEYVRIKNSVFSSYAYFKCIENGKTYMMGVYISD